MVDLSRFHIAPETERAWRLARAVRQKDAHTIDKLGGTAAEVAVIERSFREEK